VPDELARWAAIRAPDLLARAEAEAVEELKRALLEAALPRTPAPFRREPERPAPAGDGLWAYCVTRAEGAPAVNGVHAAPVERFVDDGLAVLVSRVPLAEFGEAPLRSNLNDLDWLERVARAHETVLERALELGTIVPLRICTIFADEQGVARMLAERRTALDTALEALDGRQEWGVKLLADRAAIEAAARRRAPQPLDDELAGRSEGGAYMLRRREERELRAAADRLAGDLAEDVHARLQDWASDAVVNPPQNRELSGHEGDMLLNAAYLVEAAKVERLRDVVAELQERHRELGARLELTGPWPPYNFVPRTESALA
jgi:Gas vesicle synthesis protein GvpL/GvpF